MKNPAIIHATLALGATTGAPYYDINISQTLCAPACADEKPVFLPQFSVVGIESVGTGQYLINIHVEGVISYVPCYSCCCATKTQVISQDFYVPVYSATQVSGATITAGASQNAMLSEPCKNCSKSFVSDTPVTINIATA